MKKNHTKGKIYAVNYGGHWTIQDGEMYEDNWILDSDVVGADTAEANAERIVKCWNMHDELINMIKVCQKALSTYGPHPIIDSQAKKLIKKLQS